MVVWNPLGLIGVIGCLLAWAMATVLLTTGIERKANRRLAAALFIDGTWFLAWFGLGYFTDDPQWGRPILIVGDMAMMATAWFYLSFLGTLETPLVKLFRKHGPAIAVVGASLFVWMYRAWVLGPEPALYYLDEFDTSVVAWGWAFESGVHSDAQLGRFALAFFIALGTITAASLYGVVASFHAWLRSPKESPTRSRNRLYALAFLIRDGGIILGFGGLFLLGPITDSLPSIEAFLTWMVRVPVLAEILFVPVLGYALVRTQVLRIELKIKGGLPAALALGGASLLFIITTETLEAVLAQGMPIVGNVLVAILVAAAGMPLWFGGKKLATRLFPQVDGSEAYMQARREEMYQDAFEAIISDGRIEPHERVALGRLAEKLELSIETAAKIEDHLMPPIRAPPV